MSTSDPGRGTDPASGEGIAVVGLAGRFPGARNAAEYWDNLASGKNCITHFSDEDFAASGWEPAALRAMPGFVGARGVIDRPEWFDRSFFGIAPKEAEVMDPQQRVFLEIAWEALEDAGCDPARFAGLIGVFAGMSNNTYFPFFVRARRDLVDTVGIVGAVIANEKDFLATRLSYKLNLTGPALSIQTACSSSLVAVCVACQNLRDHQCDVALAGGASITFPQHRGYFYQEGGMTSPDGSCRPFDARANGTVFSSGAGVVVLKRLEDAVADGDQIYTVIKGHALNNDGGRKVSFAAPSVAGHAEVIALAQAVAGFSPESISYVEAHGTATPLGDPIEVAGLNAIFQENSPTHRQYCALGSVKGNIGHCDAASGVASLIKVALAYRHNELPPTINCETPNPALRLEETAFYLNTTARSWPRQEGNPRRAGVSSFGVGGTNAHLVLEESPALAAGRSSRPTEILVLSAKTAAGLDQRAVDLAALLEAHLEAPLRDVAHTLQVGRQIFPHRRVVVARSRAAAVATLRSKARLSRVEDRRDTPVAFLFPGQGSQYPGMGARLHESERHFREALDDCAEILRPELGLDLRELLFATSDAAPAALRETRITQPAIFAVSYAIARLWMALGIEPAALLGHSVGEFVAAALAGVFSLEDALRLVSTRARLVQELPGGAMVAVRLPESALGEFLTDPRVSLAAVNSPKLAVIAGEFAAIEELETTWKERSIPAVRLATSHAFHSAMVQPVVAPFEEAVRKAALRPPALPIVSSVTGNWLTDAEATDPGYWSRHLRATVRFADAADCLLGQKGFAFVEAGPGQTLCQLVRQHGAANASHAFTPSIGQEDDEDDSLATALGRLWLAGVSIPWERVHEGDLRRRVSLPTYPFERQRYFADLPPGMAMPLATAATDNEPLFDSGWEPAAPKPAPSETPHAQDPGEASKEPQATMVEPADHALDGIKRLLGDLSGLDLTAASGATSLLELGFDSLFLSQTAISLSRKFGTKIAFRQLLQELGTLDALAAFIGAARPAGSNGAAPAESVASKRGLGKAPDSPAATGNHQAHGPFRAVQRELGVQLTPARKRWLSDFIQRYNARTAESKRFTQEHRRHLADPRAVAGFKQVWKEMVYPIVVDRSKGAKLWDIDGNEWTDLTLSYGAAMFGHQADFIVKAVREQLESGYEVGPTSPLAGEVAALLCEQTGMERAAFANTGSEAVTAAIRLARTVTGRMRIVYFRNSYHGISDEVLGRAGAGAAVPIAPGIPPEALSNVLILEYGEPSALEAIGAGAGDIAAVLVEPVQSRHPDFQPGEFLCQLRKVTAEQGIALIFDELITGFRCHPAGAQGFFGVQADIATYGKVLGGGMPIGAIAGKALYLDALDGGQWSFGDDSSPESAMTFFAGTFVRHPLALAAARAVLLRLRQDGPRLQKGLSEKTGEMIARINAAGAGSPFHLECFGPSWHLRTSPEFPYPGLLQALLRHRGLHLWENRPCFLSTAHTAKDVDLVVEAFVESFGELRENGFIQPSAGASAEDALASTEAQREVWLICQQSARANSACNETWTLFLTGSLQADELRSAIQKVVDRHESLRATFDRSGEWMRLGPPVTVELPCSDLSALPATQRAERLDALRLAEGERLFDLEKGPMFALQLARLGPEEHALIFNAHHLVCDGWSCDIFLREIAALYSAASEGRSVSLPAPDPFTAYQKWEAALRATPEYAADAEYWLSVYKTIPPPLELPCDRVRPVRREFRGASETLSLPAEFARRLQLAGASRGATLFSVLLAGFNALLAGLAEASDLTVGIPSAGQNLAGMDHLVGHCVNLLPVRSYIDATVTFAALLQQVQGSVLEAFEHRRVTFGWLLQKLAVPRQPGRTPLVSAIFNLDPPLSDLRFSGLAHRLEANPRRAFQFDLGLNCNWGPDAFNLICSYNSDLFDPATIQTWLQQFQQLLDAAVNSPESAIRDLLPQRRKRSGRPGDSGLPEEYGEEALLRLGRGAQTDFPANRGIHRLFEEVAAAFPEAEAVRDGGRSLTYGALNRRANQLARALRERGLGAGDVAGLCLERSQEFIVGMLAILKVGGSYLPLDPAYPAERLALMAEQTKTRIVLTGGEHGELAAKAAPVVIGVDSAAGHGQPETNLELPEDGGAVACILFTSGSTGRPKGVEIAHRGICRLVVQSDFVRFERTDVVAHASNPAFDAATLEIWGALLHGGALVIVSHEELLSLKTLPEFLREQGVTMLGLTTALFHQVARVAPRAFGALKYLTVGGETMDPEAARLVLQGGAPPKHLINGYGPTEATTCAVRQEITLVAPGATSVPIGQPIANTEIYLLDEELHPVAPGITAEIWIGGPGLARGYAGAPDLTAERFLSTRFGRLYRTGDLAQWLADGTLEFLGRKDQQIKIRGFRIEPGEIEAVLRRVSGVADCKVAARQFAAGEARLVAWYIRNGAPPPEPEEMRLLLGRSLPAYMVPSAFLEVPRFPLTPNGKLDLEKLPLPTRSPGGLRDDFAGSENSLHAQLIEVWEDLLGHSPVGIRDNFFELGGHSLLAVKMLSEIERRLGERPLLSTIFDNATIEHLAATLLTRQQTELSRELITAIHPCGAQRPFFFLHGDYVGGGFFCRTLAAEIGADRPFYAVHPHGLDGSEPPHSVEAMARERLAEIFAVQPHGPYLLGGYCNGALVAYEMARMLEAAGEKVAAVVLLMADASNYRHRRLHSLAGAYSALAAHDTTRRHRFFVEARRRSLFLAEGARQYSGSIRAAAREPSLPSALELARKPMRLWKRLFRQRPALPCSEMPLTLRERIGLAFQEASEGYVPQPFGGKVFLLWPREQAPGVGSDPSYGWSSVCASLEVIQVPGAHHSCVATHEYLQAIGRVMKPILQSAGGPPPSLYPPPRP